MTGETTPALDPSERRRFGSGVRSIVGRRPVGCYLVLAFAIFWTSWMPLQPETRPGRA